MKYRGAWLLIGALCCSACSGKAQFDANAGGAGLGAMSAGGASSSIAGAATSAGGASAGSGAAAGAATCPKLEPAEGSACSATGLTCEGYNSLSCPDVAVCAVDGEWKIECPLTPLGLPPGSCGCAHPTGSDSDAGTTRVPMNHRASGSICAAPRADAIPTSTNTLCKSEDGGVCDYAPCVKDSDCTQGLNGRCTIEGPGAPRVLCTYDECASDSDCGGSSPCQCRDAGSAVQDYCVTGSGCQVDSDCGTGGYCSPTLFNQWCGSSYQCHTAEDTCIDDSDCKAPAGCNFDATLKHWACGGDCGEPPP